MTIMSRSCAERYNLLRLMDRRWAGTAVGVGSAKILGECFEAVRRDTGCGCMGMPPILAPCTGQNSAVYSSRTKIPC